jgi:hypothetical protein
MKKLQRWLVAMVEQQYEFLMPLNCMLQNGEDDKFFVPHTLLQF